MLLAFNDGAIVADVFRLKQPKIAQCVAAFELAVTHLPMQCYCHESLGEVDT